MRRHKSTVDATAAATSGADSATTPDDDRPMRRVSYLRATANDSSLQMLDTDADEFLQSASTSSATIASPSSAEAIDAQTLAQQLKR